MPLIRIRDIGSEVTQCHFEGEFRSDFVVQKGDWLIGMDGNFNVRRWGGPDALLNQRVTRLIFLDERIEQRFVAWALQKQVFALMGTKSYTTVDHLSTKQINESLIPLPPYAEQKRIVAKVDELMALCDELEASQAQRDSIRTAARKSAIDSISTATTPEELDIAWKRISGNWLTIADTPESIASLRSLILGMAVRGKLVDQRKSEGVGSEFVSQFSGSFEPLTAPKTVPFEIPEAWVWSCLGNVSINRDSERVPISKPERETRQGPYDYYGASGVIDSFDEFLFDKPLLLIGEDGANLVNRSTPIAFMARGKYWVNNHAHVIDSTSEHALEYLALVINQMDLKPFLTGTAQPKLNQAKLNALQIPVPPFDEQKRIVAKVEELMALCGELERCMAERNKLAKKIVGAVTAEVAA
jgi:type I restriction enzyme S subunit